jgi:cytochrome b561
MLDPDRRKSYGVTSAILAWLIVFSYVACFFTSPEFDRLFSAAATGSSSPFLHVGFALIALLLVILRLIWWVKNQRPVAPKSMPEKVYKLSRFTLLLMYLNVLQLSLTGLLHAWVSGLAENLLGNGSLPVPDQELAIHLSSSHSLSWQINIVVLAIYILVNAFLGFRYRCGYRRMLPGVHV